MFRRLGPTARSSEGILAAAALANVDEVYAIGGAQAIGAMAYGTESVAAVDVIVGPGNIYVSEAKRQVASSGLVGVPSSFPGPSEVVVVADETTPADLAAIDLIVQIEHGPDGLAWLITWSEEAADRILAAVAGLVADAPRRERDRGQPRVELLRGAGGRARPKRSRSPTRSRRSTSS